MDARSVVRIVIADDHAVMRAGLGKLIAGCGDMVVVGEAADGSEVMRLVRTLAFDVLVMDLEMPGPSGVDLVMRVRQESPDLPILILSMHDSGPLVTRILKAGATGYVAKHSEAAVLLKAVRKVADGERFIDPSLVNDLVFDSMLTADEPHHALTNREYQVLKMFVQGKTVSEMAQLLRLSVKTISTHKSNVKEKLGLHADAELFRYAIDHRL